jgi:hypothetical protein
MATQQQRLMPFRGGVVRVSAMPLPPAHSSAAGEEAGIPAGLGQSSRDDAFAGFAMPGLDSMDLNDDDVDAQQLRPSYLGVRGRAANRQWGPAAGAVVAELAPSRFCQLLRQTFPPRRPPPARAATRPPSLAACPWGALGPRRRTQWPWRRLTLARTEDPLPLLSRLSLPGRSSSPRRRPRPGERQHCRQRGGASAAGAGHVAGAVVRLQPTAGAH